MYLIWSLSIYFLERGKLVKRIGDSVFVSWNSLVRLLFVFCFGMVWFYKIGVMIYKLKIIIVVVVLFRIMVNF